MPRPDSASQASARGEERRLPPEVRLVDASEVDDLRDRHLAYHLALAEAVEPQVLGAGRDDPVLQTLATELPNLRTALERAAATNPDAGLRLVDALTLYWLFTGRYQEATQRTRALWRPLASNRPHCAGGCWPAAGSSHCTAAHMKQRTGGRRRR